MMLIFKSDTHTLKRGDQSISSEKSYGKPKSRMRWSGIVIVADYGQYEKENAPLRVHCPRYGLSVLGAPPMNNAQDYIILSLNSEDNPVGKKIKQSPSCKLQKDFHLWTIKSDLYLSG